MIATVTNRGSTRKAGISDAGNTEKPKFGVILAPV